MYFAPLREDVRRWGLIRSLYVRMMERLENYLAFRLFVIHSRPLDANAPQDVLPEDCTVRLIEAQELIEHARNPLLDLSEEFVTAASARGDRCFGYLERGALASYVWIATRPTPAESGLWVAFGGGDSYSYKSFTLLSHRGRRLAQCLSHCSDRWLTSRGYRFNVDYIHTINLPSIAADRRYGNRPIGYAGYVRWCGRAHPFRSPGVRARGFRLFVPKDA